MWIKGMALDAYSTFLHFLHLRGDDLMTPEDFIIPPSPIPASFNLHAWLPTSALHQQLISWVPHTDGKGYFAISPTSPANFSILRGDSETLNLQIPKYASNPYAVIEPMEYIQPYMYINMDGSAEYTDSWLQDMGIDSDPSARRMVVRKEEEAEFVDFIYHKWNSHEVIEKPGAWQACPGMVREGKHEKEGWRLYATTPWFERKDCVQLKSLAVEIIGEEEKKKDEERVAVAEGYKAELKY